MKIIFENYSFVRVVAEDSIIYTLRDYFSFDAPNYRYNPKYKYGSWDGKIRLMSFDGKLPYGLCAHAIKFAKDNEIEYELDPRIKIYEDNTKSVEKWIDETRVYDGSNEITPHWYQKESIVYALNSKRCILNLPTSAGKSLIAAMISKHYAQRNEDKILILVPTTTLVNQMTDDFENYKLFDYSDIQLVGDGKKGDAKAYTKVVYIQLGTHVIRLLSTDKVKLSNGEFIDIKDLKIGLDLDDDWVKDRLL